MAKTDIKKSVNGGQNSLIVLIIDTVISLVASEVAVIFVRWQTEAFLRFEYYAIVWVVASLVCSLAGMLITGTHKIVIKHSSYRSISRISLAVLIKELLLLGALALNVIDFKSMGDDIFLLIVDFLLTLVMLIIFRLFLIIIAERLEDDMEVNVHRLAVMVYGLSDKSVSLLTRLEQSHHYIVAGILTRDKAAGGQIVRDHRVYYFDSQADIERMKTNLGIESVIFSRDIDSQSESEGLVQMCLACGIHILLVPKLEEVNYGGITQQAIEGFSRKNDFIPDGMSQFEVAVKRITDLILSGILLIVFSPLFAICAIAIKLGDKGPVIYKQERIGRFGRPFYIYKFRSMRVDAESAGPALYAGDDDPRLTKVGKFLRQHHLDELPQLWNVFTGDMAFIGYRPERKFYIDQIMEQDPRYYYLYQIRPGVTSYSTLKNGYTDSMEKMLRRLEFDLYYLRHRSWWFDAKILWQTFCGIVFGKKF